MAGKPGRLNAAERRDLADKAFKLSIRRVSYTEIGNQLGISRNLASTLVKEEQERHWEGRDLSEREEEKRRSIETYEATIRAAWQRLARVGDTSLNVSGLLNTIVSAQKAIDDVTGAKAPIKSENKTFHEFNLSDLPDEEFDAFENIARQNFPEYFEGG